MENENIKLNPVKKFYENHPEKKTEYILCNKCGHKYLYCNKSKHYKTKLHILIVEKINSLVL